LKNSESISLAQVSSKSDESDAEAASESLKTEESVDPENSLSQEELAEIEK